MFKWINDTHVDMGGTMDPWSPEINNVIVWGFVAICVSYLVKRIALTCKGGLLRQDRTLRESWQKFKDNGYRPDKVLEPKIEPRTIKFDLTLVVPTLTEEKSQLIVPNRRAS